jgi:hypothetical protein
VGKMETAIDTESKILINIIIKATDDFRIEETVITGCYGDNPLTDFYVFFYLLNQINMR